LLLGSPGWIGQGFPEPRHLPLPKTPYKAIVGRLWS
jgi:hypothetical protein